MTAGLWMQGHTSGNCTATPARTLTPRVACQPGREGHPATADRQRLRRRPAASAASRSRRRPDSTWEAIIGRIGRDTAAVPTKIQVVGESWYSAGKCADPKEQVSGSGISRCGVGRTC
jgi:hypothetical protein